VRSKTLGLRAVEFITPIFLNTSGFSRFISRTLTWNYNTGSASSILFTLIRKIIGDPGSSGNTRREVEYFAPGAGYTDVPSIRRDTLLASQGLRE
jgi:hypothetical protein